MELETKSEKELPKQKEFVYDLAEKLNREHQLLLKSEKKFRTIFEKSIDGLILWNDQFEIVEINSVAEKMLEISKDQPKGFTLFKLAAGIPEIKNGILQHVNQVFQEGSGKVSISFVQSDGSKKYIDISSKHEIYEGMNFTVLKDVTRDLEIQEQIRKADRLNVIGELAAGIAHEIRNPMTALKGFIQLLEESMKAEHAMYYQVITAELARIDSIINEFLIIAKPQEIHFQEKNINQIIKETVELLNAQAVLFNVQFKVCFDDSIPALYCEPHQLKKVFINIIKNAIEVMPNGGYVMITTKFLELNQIHISIHDEGIGIPKDHQKKLGEPFYTTKETGVGLGLMVSYKIIEEHKGTIQIESEEGKGTTFHIKLPLNFKNSG